MFCHKIYCSKNVFHRMFSSMSKLHLSWFFLVVLYVLRTSMSYLDCVRMSSFTFNSIKIRKKKHWIVYSMCMTMAKRPWNAKKKTFSIELASSKDEEKRKTHTKFSLFNWIFDLVFSLNCGKMNVLSSLCIRHSVINFSKKKIPIFWYAILIASTIISYRICVVCRKIF